jgi:hypothetical protein
MLGTQTFSESRSTELPVASPNPHHVSSSGRLEQLGWVSAVEVTTDRDSSGW